MELLDGYALNPGVEYKIQGRNLLLCNDSLGRCTPFNDFCTVDNKILVGLQVPSGKLAIWSSGGWQEIPADYYTKLPKF